MRGNRSRAGLDKEGGEWGTVPPWPWVAAGRVGRNSPPSYTGHQESTSCHYSGTQKTLNVKPTKKTAKRRWMEQRSEEKFQERTIFHVCSPCRPEAHSFMPKQPKRGLHNTQFTKTFCLSPKCIKLAVKRHLDPSTCVCRPDWCHSQNSSEQREFPVQILIIWLFPALWVREWVTRPSIELSWGS